MGYVILSVICLEQTGGGDRLTEMIYGRSSVLVIELYISPRIAYLHLNCVQQPAGEPQLLPTGRQDGKRCDPLY